MRNKKFMLVAGLIVITLSLSAQSSVSDVLAEISRNNKSIVAYQQQVETEKLEFKTGNTPENPSVEYDFLAGRPAEAGDQQEVIITQPLNFPTTYFKKSDLADLRSSRSDLELSELRQQIMLEAKIICIELVYHQKCKRQYEDQKKQAEKLVADYTEKLTSGDGNILDVNKAKLQLLDIDKQLNYHSSSMISLNAKLTALNGGIEISFNSESYPEEIIPLTFDQLVTEFNTGDPHNKVLTQEKLIREKQVEVNRSLSLPKIELGYHYQTILGQTFNGIHTGITIPLWEHRNTVKAGKSQVLFAELEILDYQNSQRGELFAHYEKAGSLQETLDSYREVFATYTNTDLLNKALATGHITTIEYFMETTYYMVAMNNYLDSEREYYESLAVLYRYRL